MPANGARRTADQATGDQFDKIIDQAPTLERIFRNLALTAATTYQVLVSVVDEATRKHQSIAQVVSRVKALGVAGSKLADAIETLNPSGTLKTLTNALKK